MTPTQEIRLRHGGAVRQSDWKTPSPAGQFKKPFRRRPVPPLCKWVHPCELGRGRYPEQSESRAREIMAKHPRTRGLILYVGPN